MAKERIKMQKRDVTTSMTDVALKEKKGWKLSLFPTPSPAREPLVRYLQVKVRSEPYQSHVRARYIPPSDQ